MTRALIAKVHIAKQALGMTDADYRDLLQRTTGRRSSKQCNGAQLGAVLDEFKRLGWQGAINPWAWINTAPAERRPLLRKIVAIAAEQQRSPEYINGIAEQMFKIGRLQFCSSDQLLKIVQALEIHARRQTK